MENRPGSRDPLHKLRLLYWRARHMAGSKTLSFFVCRRQSDLPSLGQTRIEFGGMGHEPVVERLAQWRGDDPGEYRARLAAGHWVIYAAGEDGEVQSWGWVTAPTDKPQNAPWEYGVWAKVSPGTGYLWDYFTLPAYRGRGLYKALLQRSADQCFVRGAARVWIYAEISNTASRRGIMGADYGEEIEIQAARIGPICRFSRRGFQCTVRVGGVVELDALLPRET